MSQKTSSSGTAARADWFSAYVHTREPLRDVLLREVAPFVSEVRAAGLAERFFFIRYWDGGAHLRLRFYGDVELLRARLQPAVEERFGRHRLELVPYEPEIDRYGGPDAITIAEDCFDLSSRVALEILRETDDDGARGAAMLLHVALAHLFGMTRGEAAGFFESVARSRLPRGDDALFRNTRVPVPTAPLLVWETLERGEELELAWLQQWIAGLRGIRARLDSVTVRPQRLTGHFLRTVPPRFADRWMVLSSYVHMTNNRLGVLSLDEPHIAFLLSRGLAP